MAEDICSHYEGPERRKIHGMQMLPECTEIFKRIDEKLDGLIARFDTMNGKYEKHLDESTIYRKEVGVTSEKVKELFYARNWFITLLIFIFSSIIGIAGAWGSLLATVDFQRGLEEKKAFILAEKLNLVEGRQIDVLKNLGQLNALVGVERSQK